MSWHREALVGFDLETTGTEPLEARIVTAAVVGVDGRDGEPVRQRTWLADPGIRIPAQASAIHGISSERAAAEGRPRARWRTRSPRRSWATGARECRSSRTTRPSI